MRIKNITGLLTVMLAGFLITTSSLAQSAKSIAIVLSTRGSVQIQKPGADWKDLKFGAVLDAGDHIHTGAESFAAIVFTDDKSQLKLRPGTDIILNAERLDDYSLAKRVNMEIGELFTEVKRQKGSMQVATPTAVASVKGTQFWVLVGPDGETEQLTMEGVVELLSLITGESIEITAGQKGTVDPLGNINYQPIEPEEVPESFEEQEFNFIELNFMDEDGQQKKLILRYQIIDEE